jgi:hypothetical protein
MSVLESISLQTNYIAPTSFSQNGGIVQVVDLQDSTPRTQAVTSGRVTVTGISATITPRRATNSILVYVRWCGEITTLWNCSWGLRRNGVDIGDPPFLSAQQRGITCGMDSYATTADNNDSTPAQAQFWYRDSPGVTSAVTYQLTLLQLNSATLATNRCLGDADTAGYERMISSIILMEVSG